MDSIILGNQAGNAVSAGSGQAVSADMQDISSIATLSITAEEVAAMDTGATVMSLRKSNGNLNWATVVDTNPAAIITQGAVVDNGVVYVGVSSGEELFAAVIPGYPCCNFRGSMVALDAETGEILWKTYTTPVGFSGGMGEHAGSGPNARPRIRRDGKQLFGAR